MDKAGGSRRTVWLLARPLSYSQWLPPLADTSEGKYHLCHWAILVSELYDEELLRASVSLPEHICLGDLYELARFGDKNTMHLSTGFNVARFRADWSKVSLQQVGFTTMTDHQVSEEGLIHLSFPLANR